MPQRTTAPAVSAVIETKLTGDEVLPFIHTASLMVDEHLSTVTPAITPALLTEIETYLAAHFITLHEPRAQKEEADGVRFEYEGTTGEGLDSSRYGQQAQILDPTGTLSQLNKKGRIGWISRVGNERDVEG